MSTTMLKSLYKDRRYGPFLRVALCLKLKAVTFRPGNTAFRSIFFLLPSLNTNSQSPATVSFIILGVTKINNSCLVLLVVELVNKNPIPGKSAKNGILFLP